MREYVMLAIAIGRRTGVDSRRSPRDMLWAPDLNLGNEADDRQSICETHA